VTEQENVKKVRGIWFPEKDTHFKGVMTNENDYQLDRLKYAMKFIDEPKVFYDIGAHVGLWSLMALRRGFKKVFAYEPNQETFNCYKLNLKGYNNVQSFNYGVSNVRDQWMRVDYESKNNTGAVTLGSCEKGDSSANAVVAPIDGGHLYDLIDELQLKVHQTLVKIDTEGMEAQCVLGMEKHIYALRPVMIVEQRSNEDAIEILQKMGMKIEKCLKKDYILTWR